ncbi:MAG: hypothetical protein JW748_04950 [Anaerolineales bacterium]|nr:hypothetical protein [Anaerolineales bacterium]
MGRKIFTIRFTRAAALMAAGFLLTACSLPLSLPGLGGVDAPASGGGQDLEGGEPPIVPLECPKTDEKATLTFRHDIQFGLEGVGQFGIAVSGTYQINIIHSIATYQPGDRVGVYNFTTGPLPVVLTAKDFEDCENGAGATNMRADVLGNCYDGTLTLIIQEYYEAGSVTVMCGEGDDKEPVEIPIPIGPLEQPVTWSMPYSQLAGGMTMRKQVPFAGMGGSGGMSYTLTMP